VCAVSTYLADGLSISNGVRCLGALVTRFKVVVDKRWTQRLNHQVVVVQGSNDNGGVNAVKRSRDVGSRHFDVLLQGSSLQWRIGVGDVWSENCSLKDCG
jgi:hypothetical protein